MSETSSKSASTQEVRTYEFKGIQIYGRKGPDGAFSKLDSIDEDESKESPAHLRQEHDPASGLALIRV